MLEKNIHLSNGRSNILRKNTIKYSNPKQSQLSCHSDKPCLFVDIDITSEAKSSTAKFIQGSVTTDGTTLKIVNVVSATECAFHCVTDPERFCRGFSTERFGDKVTCRMVMETDGGDLTGDFNGYKSEKSPCG